VFYSKVAGTKLGIVQPRVIEAIRSSQRSLYPGTNEHYSMPYPIRSKRCYLEGRKFKTNLQRSSESCLLELAQG